MKRDIITIKTGDFDICIETSKSCEDSLNMFMLGLSEDMYQLIIIEESLAFLRPHIARNIGINNIFIHLPLEGVSEELKERNQKMLQRTFEEIAEFMADFRTFNDRVQEELQKRYPDDDLDYYDNEFKYLDDSRDIVNILEYEISKKCQDTMEEFAKKIINESLN